MWLCAAKVQDECVRAQRSFRSIVDATPQGWLPCGTRVL